VYIDALGTSLARSPLQGVFESPQARALLSCDVEACCPNPEIMLDDWRGHTVRTRVRSVSRLVDVPASGRLGFAVDRLGAELAAIDQANRWLHAHQRHPVKARGPRQPQRVLEHVRSTGYGAAA
jgi:hypothetical protein